MTDHQALKYMLNNKDKTARMHRMVARLSPYEITFYYKPGKENHAADLLSREKEYMTSDDTTDIVSKSACTDVNMHALTRASLKHSTSSSVNFV